LQDEYIEKKGSHEPTEFKKTPKKAALSGWIGSVLEYYDFGIYATAAALVFPTVFFPAGNPQVALVASLATYGVGYLARPIGAVVLGHFGDRHGRKRVLVLCMFVMGVSTFAVGLIPSYAQIGIWAPALLVLLRVIQGFAVAGELGGASAMIVEHAPFGTRGYYASFALQGTQAAAIIAAGVFLPLSALLSDDAFMTWGWRIPFFLSAVVVAAGYIIRRRVDETPAFREAEKHEVVPKAPVVEVFGQNGPAVLRALLIGLTNVVGTTVITFGAAYATQPGYGIGLSKTLYLWIPVAANVVALFMIPFYGRLSDRIGRRPLVITGAITGGILTIPYLYAVGTRNELLAMVLAVLIIGIAYQAWNATYACFFQEMFPTRTRVTGFAIAQNVSLAIVAFLPTVFALVAPPGATGIPLTIGAICIVITLISATAAFFSRETFRVHLDDLGTPDAVPVPREQYDRIRVEAGSV
jgi:MFS family permease